MEPKTIIMNYTVPPGLDDIEALARSVMDSVPEEIRAFCEDIELEIEEIPDDTTLSDLNADDAYDVPAFYKSSGRIAPGIEKKSTSEEDILVLYRRALLDIWCETCDDLSSILRQVIIEEIARHHDFADDDIDEMIERHYQGLL